MKRGVAHCLLGSQRAHPGHLGWLPADRHAASSSGDVVRSSSTRSTWPATPSARGSATSAPRPATALNGIAGFYRAFAGLGRAGLAPRAVHDAERARRPRATCSSRTSSGSAAARSPTCSPSGGCTGSTRSCASAGRQGVVLGGVSAGSICWYVGGPTDSYGLDLRVSPPGLGLLPYGSGVHYDSEEQRRPLLHKLVGDGVLPTSHATDDGVGPRLRGHRARRGGLGPARASRRTSSSGRRTAASPRPRIEPRLLG